MPPLYFFYIHIGYFCYYIPPIYVYIYVYIYIYIYMYLVSIHSVTIVHRVNEYSIFSFFFFSSPFFVITTLIDWLFRMILPLNVYYDSIDFVWFFSFFFSFFFFFLIRWDIGFSVVRGHASGNLPLLLPSFLALLLLYFGPQCDPRLRTVNFIFFRLYVVRFFSLHFFSLLLRENCLLLCVLLIEKWNWNFFAYLRTKKKKNKNKK